MCVYKLRTLSVTVDDTLLHLIRTNPGLSLYELSKLLGWTIGKTDGTLRRLNNAGKIQITSIERNGRLVTLVYPREHKAKDILEVPKRLLVVGNPLWKDTGHLYALDNSTIGITGEPLKQWRKISCFHEKVPLRNNEDRFSLRIPDRFVSFYNLNAKHFTKTVNGNRIILTIDGTIVGRRPYPARRN